MRTTLNIDDALLAHARRLAAETRRSLGDVVDDALRVLLAARTTRADPPQVALPVFGGTGLLPGVDLEDKDGLAALIDEPWDLRAAR